MNLKQIIKHWIQIDHITFLLIGPALLIDKIWLAWSFWIIALVYDLYEGYTNKEQ